MLAVWLLVLTYSTRYVSTVPPEYRLPGDVVPSHYDIRLLYDIDPGTGFSFYGVVYIHIKAKEPTSKIILHSQNNYGKINISGETHSPSVVESNLNDTFNLLTIDLDSHLDVHDTYILTIPFSGNVTTTDMFGVYASYYDNKKSGSREYFIATQFEAIFARRAFPCFDEPIYKATFGLTLGHNKGHVAISNMPIKKSFNSNALSPYWTWNQVTRTIKKAQSDFIWDRFTDSVAMPTYLVAYVISKMAYRESPDTSKWKFRVWAQPNAIDQTKYALTIGTKILKYYEEWFNLPFPLPKQDMVAIPDFGEGGMENWGLVMFRASNLLFDEKQSSYVEKENIAMVIAHELAHQWFGNLVTMKWWSDLWLNEGFATFVSTLGVAAAEPKWDYSFQGYEIISILEMDALESSHPVSLEIKDPADIMQVFDAISYFKGKILIRMITMFLGNKIFKEAIHNYLVKYSYSNAEQDDLWAELTAVSHKYKVLSKNVTIKQVMDSWTTQPGFPLLTVTRNYDTKTLAVTQARFLAINKNNITSSSAWWIPLRLTCEPDTSPQAQPLYWVADNEGITKQLKYEHASSPNEWVLINSDMIAPYRVNYDNRNWMLLVKALRSPQFMKVPKLGRMQLLSDAFQLAWTNRLNYSIALSLASYLQQEEQYGPLEIGMRALFNIQTILKRTQHYSVFKKFMRKIITKRYLKSGGLASKKIVNGDNLESVKMQTLLSQWACHMEISGCEENAIELFQRWMDTKNPDVENPIPLDLRSTVYCTAVSRGGEKHWQFVLDRKRRANAATAAETLQQALSCTSKTWVYMQMLEWVLAEYSEVRAQDSAHLICDILQSSIGFYVAKDFVYTKTKELHNVLPTGSLGRIASVLLDQLITQKQLDEFLKWRDENAQYLTNANLVIEQGIESARVNIEWVEHNMDTVVQMLKDDVE